MTKHNFNLAFISGKLGGTDGVSLETDKMGRVLLEQGHNVFTIAGSYDSPLDWIPEENQLTESAICFNTKHQKTFEKHFYPFSNGNTDHVSYNQEGIQNQHTKLRIMGSATGNRIYEMLVANGIDAIISENLNTIPMSLVGAMAVKKISENGVYCFLHHHDFAWERSRYRQSVQGIVDDIVPVTGPLVDHFVISSYAQHNLLTQRGFEDATIVPNCEDFNNPPVLDDYNSDFRKDMRLSEKDIIVTQPTRIVRRKNIEQSVEFVHKLGEKSKSIKNNLIFLISLYDGDESDSSQYKEEIANLASSLDVDTRFISERIGSSRSIDSEGNKIYTHKDVLANSNLVTYLPSWEGFGNAFIESTVAKVPIVVSPYLVYKTDIAAAGFRNIVLKETRRKPMEYFIDDEVIDQALEILNNEKLRQECVNHNFEVGQREFGLDVLKERMNYVFRKRGQYEILASGERIRRSKRVLSV